jgi:Fe-S-cluster containining protein
LPNEETQKNCRFDVCYECKLSCCRDAKPPITKKRRRIIEEYLKKEKISLNNPFTQADYCFPTVDKMGFCIFYHKPTKKCLVHTVKPETCKAGPVTFDINRHTKKVEWFLKTAVLCSFAEQLYQDDAQFKAHFNVSKAEILRLIQGLDAEALRAIMRIEEPQTFKIDEDALPKEIFDKLSPE